MSLVLCLVVLVSDLQQHKGVFFMDVHDDMFM